MRPITLTMSAFGSYAGRERIDFEKAGKGVFLITGDTGSGKTTIFDAIMYALYDQTSGGRRDGNMMRSQYADLHTETYVELEFEYKDRIYRIVRSPEYERESKRRGRDGSVKKVVEKSRVALYLPDGTEFMGKKQETNRKIVEIIGLDASQFTQTAMIAQGEFLRLLLAKSDERKEIFSRLFDTQVFSRMQRQLKERAKSMYGELADGQKAKERELSHLLYPKTVGFAGSAVNSEEEENPAQAVDPEYEKRIEEASGTEEILEIIEEMEQEIRAGESACIKTAGLIQEKSDRINRKLALARENNLLFEKLADARKRIEELAEQQRLCEEKEKRLSLGERAEKVRRKAQAALEVAQSRRALQRELEELQKWLVQKEKEKEEKEKLLAKICLAVEYQKENDKVKENLAGLRSLKENLMEYVRKEKQQKQAYTELLESDRQYREADAEYFRLNDAFLKEQAGILALELEEARPCPVCGSLRHPAPAQVSGDAPSQQDVRAARKERDKREKEKDTLQNAFVLKRQECKVQEERLQDEGKRILGEAFDLSEESLLENLKGRVAVLENAGSEYSRQMQEIEEEVRRWEEFRACAGQTDWEEVRREVEESLAALQAGIHVRKGEQRAKKKQKDEIEIYAEKAQKEYEEGWKEAGFLSEKTYHAGLLKEEEQEELKQWCERFKEQKIRETARWQTLEKEAEGREPTATEEMEAEKRLLWHQKEEIELQQKQLYRQRENNRNVRERLEQIYRETETLQEQYALLQNLNQTANGNLAGSAKIDFESYVQRQYFRQVIQHANRRLAEMTGNQFQLRCRALDALGGRGNAGLDLDVYSMVTGTVRDVKTLSGGESFMAALAMALGLADVIQSMSGGIRLNTMFVDEGFGSLDEYAREQAIRVLAQLAGNGRMIGIISHVAELAESIDRQLVVTKTKKGSKAQWRIS